MVQSQAPFTYVLCVFVRDIETRCLNINAVSICVSAVKLTEEVDVEADVFYPITCGDAKATLVWKKFVCPGINVKCVQVCDGTCDNVQ